MFRLKSYLFLLLTNPISPLGPSGGSISFFMASKTALNCWSYFFSRSSSLFASSAFDPSICLSRTKARMISTLTATARLLRSTLDNIATPCSVNAIGAYRRPCRSALEVTNRDLQVSNSDPFRTNIKSSGNRSGLRRTACLRTLVSTPYSAARSRSSITFSPRIR